MSDKILQVEKLIKNYGSFKAVDGISFDVQKGQVVGFLGPNGAGKTTTIQMLLGITTSNGGTIKFFDKEFYKYKYECLKRINYTSAFNTLLGKISVFENLLVFATLYEIKNPKKKIQELLEYFEIDQLSGILYQYLSAGQKTRVNLVKSLINDPDLILMDEPTASLDPDIADKTLTLIEDLKKERNLSILFTSHNMNEITRICDEVIFLDQGKIVAQDTPLNLTKRINQASIQLIFDKGKELIERYLSSHDYPYQLLDNHIVVIDTEEKLIPKILFGISKTGVLISDINIQKPSLEDVFLQIARKDQKV